MSAEVYEWPKRSLVTSGGRGGGGDGPRDPMIEERVAALERTVVKLEFKIDRIEEALRRIELALRELAADNKDFRKQLADLTAKGRECRRANGWH